MEQVAGTPQIARNDRGPALRLTAETAPPGSIQHHQDPEPAATHSATGTAGSATCDHVRELVSGQPADTSRRKWITFRLTARPALRKTDIWVVVPNDGGFNLGLVKWYTGWRRYCFFPASDSLFEQDCLRDIADFCESETRKHRAAAQTSEGTR